MTSFNCPDNDRLAAYLKGALPEPEAEAVEEHLSACDTCETALRSLDHLSDTLRSAFRDGSVESSPFNADPQFRRAVEAICGLAEGKALPPQQSPQDADRSPPARPRTLGEYEILQRLGSGGMGTVYKALHTRLNRLVALKMLREGRHDDATASARFDREMRAVGTLDHPNIVRALDAREIDGTRFLVMELVEGMDLAELSRQSGPLPIADGCELIRQAALGLQSAYERGLVHRDIKPSNLMLTPQGQVKVLDLGLALFQAQPPTETEMTASGQAVGTAEYMAPEQVSDSHQVDIRADIYSLGGTLYRLLSGHAPFDGPQYRTQMEKMAAHLRDPIRPIRRERKDVPEALAAVLDKMLAKSPADRYATPGEVAAVLVPFCAACDLPAVLRRAREGDVGNAAGVNTEELCSSAMESTGASKRAGPLPNADRLSETAAHIPPGARRRWRRPAVLAGVLAAAAAVVFLTVFFVRTRLGTLVIDADPPGAEVSIDDGKITLVMPQVREPIEIRLRPGEHTFQVQQGGFSTETGSFTLEAGGRKVLAVKLQEAPPPAIANADGKWKLPPGAPLPAVAPFDDKQAKEHQAAWARHLGVPVEMTNSIGMKLVLIPPGEFMMGEGGDTHKVKITKPFYLGKYEVTQEEWEAVLGKANNLSQFKGPKNPVENVSWEDCQLFFRKLNEKLGGARGSYRLPTEAQWEYACRAGTTGGYCFGDNEIGLEDYGWFENHSGKKTHPVGGKKPNGWGLFDMHGHVREWCSDWFGQDYYKASPGSDPMGPPSGSDRVARGGGWDNGGWDCRSAKRFKDMPGSHYNNLGFRVSLVLPETAAESAKMSRSGDSVQTSGGSPANKPPLAVASVDSSSAVRLPAVGSLVGADGKWKLPPGAPPPAVAPFDEKQAKEHQAAWAKHLGVPVEITNSIGMKLVLIPPGEFMMGSPKELIEEELKTPDVDPWYKEHLPSEGPRHQVRITRPFCLGMYEVTQDEYQRVMGKNPSAFCATGNSKDAVAGQETKRFPVEQVSWDEAAEFCRKLSEMSEERAARRRYCLPTEAQWEYACRAGSQTQWHFGDEKPRLWEYGWFNENAGDKTHCVGQLKANPFGLFDMYGNVWEFCADWWYDKYYAITPEDDPTGSPAGSRRVRRGGSWTWTVPAGRCRSANRDSFTPGDNWADLGFRAALVLADAAGPD